MLEKIGIGILTKVVKEGWERVKNKRQRSKNASHDYDNPYKKRHGQLKVSCVGMEAARSLDEVYVAVQFLDKRKAATYGSTENIERVLQESSERHFDSTLGKRQDGMRVANNEQYLMVLGGPGVGKSTFLRKVGLEALKRKDGDFKHERTPVFLELKRFTEDEIAIEALIVNEFKVCGYPYPELMANDKLEAGELLILFDGLDEVPTPNVHNVINKIKDFVDQYTRNRFIVSLREGAYTGGFTKFAVVEIADFDDSQIQDYINNWFASGAHRKMKTSERCLEALNATEYRSIKALAQNPLSLALLCTIYEESQSFPPNRAILYKRILSIFLKKWTAEKHVRRDSPVSPYLDILTIKEMLSEIAAENFKANRFLFSEDELIDQIQEFYQRRPNTSSEFDASGILDAILVEPGLFIEQVNGSYSFSHLTFQEYLTANYIVGDPRLIQDLVNQHLHDPRWREIFLLTAGLMREADDLLVVMEAKAARSINTDGLESLSQWVKQKTDTTDDRYKNIIKRSFILRQFFSLWLLNKIYEVFENVVNHAPARDLYLCRDIYLTLCRDLYLCRDIYLDLTRDIYLALVRDRDLCRDIYLDHVRDRDLCRDIILDRDIALALDRDIAIPLALVRDLYHDRDIALALYPYQDFYEYIDADFYQSVSSQSRNRFDKQLQKQIALVKGMKDMKIFKQVDLQRMVQRFDGQREIIKAAAEGKSVEPPAESIHDTWLSVLGITDEMIAIPRETLAAYVTYLEAVEFIIACKEAAGRVSPEVWQQIEDRFLTADAADIKN